MGVFHRAFLLRLRLDAFRCVFNGAGAQRIDGRPVQASGNASTSSRVLTMLCANVGPFS
jgi:hypothetical protein